MIRRRFITVQGRRVHYLRSGEGPPVLLVHSSPANAWYLEPLIHALADRFTCFAFDTPGFGLSDALPGDELTVADLSSALAANMAAIGLPPCPAFGTHTGAAIVLSLAAHHPQRVTAAVIDAVPIFTSEELAAKFVGYFESLQLDPLGSHFTRTWTRFRDQSIWFPWTSRRPADLNPYGVGTTESIHGWTMAYFHAAATYAPAYRAATNYGAQATIDAAALSVPAVFTALESDMLHGHLRRLPALGPLQEIRAIGNDKAARDALTVEYFERHPAASPAPVDAGTFADRQFFDLPASQLHLRRAGQATDALPVVFLHDAPGSTDRFQPLIAELAREHVVLAPDLPGCGGSGPLPGTASIDDIADAVLAVLAQAGATRFVACGVGIGASVALALAQRQPNRVAGLVLHGLLQPTEAERAELRAHLAPPIELQADGSHWYRTWLMLRDSLIYTPWFRPEAASQRRVEADFSAEALHRWTVDVMRQRAGYAQAIHAALDHDAAAALKTIAAPVLFAPDAAALRTLTRQ